MGPRWRPVLARAQRYIYSVRGRAKARSSAINLTESLTVVGLPVGRWWQTDPRVKTGFDPERPVGNVRRAAARYVRGSQRPDIIESGVRLQLAGKLTRWGASENGEEL